MAFVMKGFSYAKAPDFTGDMKGAEAGASYV